MHWPRTSLVPRGQVQTKRFAKSLFRFVARGQKHCPLRTTPPVQTIRLGCGLTQAKLLLLRFRSVAPRGQRHLPRDTLPPSQTSFTTGRWQLNRFADRRRSRQSFRQTHFPACTVPFSHAILATGRLQTNSRRLILRRFQPARQTQSPFRIAPLRQTETWGTGSMAGLPGDVASPVKSFPGPGTATLMH
jgi:hypothetical protein